MNKLQTLLSYRDDIYKVLDTWVLLGKQKINITSTGKNNTRYFKGESLYVLKCKKSELNGSLIWCLNDYSDSSLAINWEGAQIADWDLGYLTFGNNIVSPTFRIILTGEDYTVDIDKYEIVDPQFVPFSENTPDKVNISDRDYREILTCIGGPYIKEEELEYSRDEICELAIEPAIREVCRWVPVVKPEEIKITLKRQNVLIPDGYSNVVGLSLQQNGGLIGSGGSNPFTFAYEQQLFGNLGWGSGYGSINSMKRPHTNISGKSAYLTNRDLQQGIVNWQRRVHYEGPYTIESAKEASDLGFKDDSIGKKYVVISSNTQGQFNIWFSKYTLNFNDIEPGQKDNLIKLCQANVKILFGELRRQQKSDIPGIVDYKYLIEEGKKDKEDVIKELKGISQYYGVMRGSL